MPRQGEWYRHFKGNTYVVLGVVLDSEDLDKRLVVYMSTKADRAVYARPLHMWFQRVSAKSARGRPLRFVKLRGVHVPLPSVHIAAGLRLLCGPVLPFRW